MDENYVIEMLHIRKEFPGIVANDDVTIRVKKGEIHALLGENGAGKSTLMSILFGLYQPEEGIIKKDGKEVKILSPNDATALHIGMVHQHFKLVEIYTVLDNIILGNEKLDGLSKGDNFLQKIGFVNRKEARKRIVELSNKYGLSIDPDAKIEDITVGMQQRTEILKMLYRNNDVLIFDEPTSVLTEQEIQELMLIMKNLAKEGKSILFITHKLNEILEVADTCTVLRKGKCIGTVDVKNTNAEELSEMMVGRKVQLVVEKDEAKPGEKVLEVKHLTMIDKIHKTDAVKNISFSCKRGEILCIAGVDGNGQQEMVFGISGIEPMKGGQIILNGVDVTRKSIRYKNTHGISHIPADRHKQGLVLDFSLENNMVLQRYFEPEFRKLDLINKKAVRDYTLKLIDKYDIRSGQGAITTVRSMSGGNQQKIIVARELDRKSDLIIAVQPTRGLDVGAIEYIHKEIVKKRDEGCAVLLVSLEIEVVMSLSDRILVMHQGEIVAELDPKKTTLQELGLYMSGAKRMDPREEW